MTQPRLSEALKIAHDLYRMEAAVARDWAFRKDDIGGAWSDEGTLGRLRVAALAPLSLAEHGLKRGIGSVGTAASRKLLDDHLKALAGTPEATPYGTQLASAVVAAMHTRMDDPATRADWVGIMNSHKDYCGMGLEYRDQNGQRVFRYGHVNDGFLDPDAVLQFTTDAAMVAWLAGQSDLSLSGLVGQPPLLDWQHMGNQRLTRARLEAFLAV